MQRYPQRYSRTIARLFRPGSTLKTARMLVRGSKDPLSDFKVGSSGAHRTLAGLHHGHVRPWSLGNPHRRRFFVLGLACFRFFRFFGSRKNAVPRRARSSDVTTEVGNIAGPRQNHVLEGPDGAVTASTSGRARSAPWHPLRRLGPLLGTSATPIERGKRYTRRSENRENAIRPPRGFYNRA